MTSERTQEYDDALVALLELVWGEGYMELELLVADGTSQPERD